MNRRNSLKALITAAGGIVVMPSWAQQWTRETVPSASAVFNNTEEQVIAAMADTIIPGGKDPGALSVGVDKFLVGLLANCYEPEVQENVKRQVAELNARAQSTNRKSFVLCDQAERETLLLSLAGSSDKQTTDFFDLIKSETIRGFNTSKEIMLGYFKYKVVPGHYYGCVDATS
jgi:hypothetical protein